MCQITETKAGRFSSQVFILFIYVQIGVMCAHINEIAACVWKINTVTRVCQKSYMD